MQSGLLKRRIAVVRLADSLLFRAGLGEPPVSTDLVRRFNPELHIAPAKLAKLSGTLKVSGDNQADGERVTILFNDSQPIARQRFSIAHEYGHYLLHHLQSLDAARYPSPKSQRQKESEADLFASSLLVPLWLLDARAPDFGYDDATRPELDKLTLKLASRFSVSRSCMAKALFQLYHLRKALAG